MTKMPSMKSDRNPLIVLACLGLALGGLLGIAGTFAPTAALRSLAWGIDGLGIVTAGALLTLKYFRDGHDVVAAGFLVLAIGQSVILLGAPMSLDAAVPSFGAGVSMWALALLMTSIPKVFPTLVRVLGLISAALFLVVATHIFIGDHILATTSPLPAYAYPVFVATFAGWIWTLLRERKLA